MRNVKWLLAAGLIAATTAGCVESNGYPNTAYNNGYYYAYNNTPRRGPNGTTIATAFPTSMTGMPTATASPIASSVS